MQSKKIEDVPITNQGGDLGEIANAVMQTHSLNNNKVLNKSLLPSKGLYYPENITYKKLTTIDIKNLSTMTSENMNGVMNGILSRCIDGVNVNDILLGDKMWFIFFLRCETYNDIPTPIKYKCPECEKSGIYQMRFSDMTVDYLNEDFKLEYELYNGDIVKLAYPTIANEIQCNMILKEPEKYSIEPIDEQILDIAPYIKEINGKKISLMKSYEYIKGMDGITWSDFGNYMADNSFGVRTYVKIKCDCGNTIEAPLSFGSDYFMPKIKREKK